MLTDLRTAKVTTKPVRHRVALLLLIGQGVLACALFSATFVLNEMMHYSGGHWLWSGILRVLVTILLLLGLLYGTGGLDRLRQLGALFVRHWMFWVMTGSIGFGAFYSLICYSAAYSPSWVVAATWQCTLVASLLVMRLFGHHIAKRIWFFSTLVFIGVAVINLSQVEHFTWRPLLIGGGAVLLAGFFYPLGNQLLWQATQGSWHGLPHIQSPLLANAFNKVLLLTIGSLPFWAVLAVFIQPSKPSAEQWLLSSLVALFSGVLGTSLFLHARGQAQNASELAAVDASQASEVVFATLGGMLLLANPMPGIQALIGMLVLFFGLAMFVIAKAAAVTE